TTVLVVVGDVDVEFAFDEVARLYGDLPVGEAERTPSPIENGAPGFRFRELSGDIQQTQIAMGWRTPGTLHADSAPLDTLATVLGAGRASRLYRATRERKLVSSITAFNYTPRDVGVFAIQAESPPDRASAALEATWDQLRRLRDDGVGALEIERARRITESRWVRRLEDMEGQANHLAEWESLGNWQLGDRYFESVMTAGRIDLADAARAHLSPDNASVLVYRPAGSPVVADSPDAARALLDAA